MSEDFLIEDGEEFNPDEEIIPEGFYRAHIVSLSVEYGIATKSGKIADVYKPVAKIEEPQDDGTKTEEELKKMELAKGQTIPIRRFGYYFFRKKEGYEYNAKDNVFYYLFLKNLQFPVKRTKKGTVILPAITESDIRGYPCIVHVVHESFTGSSGETITVAACNEILPWEDGKRIEVRTDDDIPF